MNLIKSRTRWPAAGLQLAGLLLAGGLAAAPAPVAEPTLRIEAGRVLAPVSPRLYGLMTEEINYSYAGGLYGELIRNRAFKASAEQPSGWTAVGGGAIALDPATPLNAALNTSLKLTAVTATAAAPAGIANGGYWGIPIRPRTAYDLSFYARADGPAPGALTASLTDADQQTVFASVVITGITAEWRQFHAVLTTAGVPVSKTGRFTLTTASPGAFWFQQVSLFPPTFDHQANGNRPDLMQLLAALHPAFLRLPGGNYLEGDYFSNRFDWKKTIGNPATRPGHESPWGYWSTDGFGLMEYLRWCEELHMEPLLAVFAGYSLKGDHVNPGPDLQPCVQDALDEIEYVTGSTGTRWGAARARDGHPAPFPLHYVEIGNEDEFDRSGSYDGRFAQFFRAIKAADPALQIIATARVKSVTPDLLDEHYYRSEEEMEAHAHDYDRYPRDNPTRIFVGEWATRVGWPTPDMAGALGDAAWMTGMERNSDVVLMSSYAPLFVNVSDLASHGSMQWSSDLIGYDACSSYGSPSYYAQQMFSTRHGDEVLAVAGQDVPTYTWQTTAPQQVPALFFDATRNHESGRIFLKVVNRLGTPQTVNIQVSGVSGIKARGTLTTLQGDRPDDTNSLEQPRHIVPKTRKIKGLGANFQQVFPPYSISVLELAAQP